MSFPLNLLSLEEIVAELKRRKVAETQLLRDRIDGHIQAIRELEARLALLTKVSVNA